MRGTVSGPKITTRTHVSMFPRWWWEARMSAFSAPRRETEEALNQEFRDRDWWGRFFVRVVTDRQAESDLKVP